MEAVEAYVDWRRAHGAKFIGSAWLLHRFCKHVGGDIDCGAVEEEDVLGFLAGNGPLTRYRARKYGTMVGFWRYAVSRDHATRSPLPALDDEPRTPEPVPPYVFSCNELQRLFGAVDTSLQRPVQLDSGTLRVLLLLLYGAGPRPIRNPSQQPPEKETAAKRLPGKRGLPRRVTLARRSRVTFACNLNSILMLSK